MNSRHGTESFMDCHPERSEGAAFIYQAMLEKQISRYARDDKM
jgi:hypothetical protein